MDVFDVDLFELTATFVASVHAAGGHVICYVNAGAFEDWRPDAAAYPAEILGAPLDDWPGERWLDMRAPDLRPIVLARLDLAVQKGCDGVDPDNVDGWSNDTGFPISADDQLTFNRFLATEAHRRGLSIGLKNDLDQIPDLVAAFDWIVDEECFLYSECEALAPFITAGKPVFQVEYGGADVAARVCAEARAQRFSTLVLPLALDGSARVSCDP